MGDTALHTMLLPPRTQVACETATKTGMVMVFGEITTAAKVDYEAIVRKTCREIGFTSEDVGLDADTCKVLVHIEEQSPDIGQGVHGMGTKTLEEVGAGDQGHMFGYATVRHGELGQGEAGGVCARRGRFLLRRRAGKRSWGWGQQQQPEAEKASVSSGVSRCRSGFRQLLCTCGWVAQVFLLTW
jgi:hypothetical protein